MTRYARGTNPPGRVRPGFHKQFPQSSKLPHQSFGKTINKAKALTGDAAKAMVARLATDSGALGFSYAEEDSGGASSASDPPHIGALFGSAQDHCHDTLTSLVWS